MPGAPIIVELRGRLGNQLSQFAATYALSRRLAAPLRFSSRRLGSEPLLLPFSWWGAWLAAQRGDHSVERFVCTPSAWYFPDGVRAVVAERWDVADA